MSPLTCVCWLKLWDFDSDGNIDIDEFCRIFEEIEASKHVVLKDALRAGISATQSQAEEEKGCDTLKVFGAGCCLCTLCLSWLPLYCRMRYQLDASNHKAVTTATPFLAAKRALLKGPNKSTMPPASRRRRQTTPQCRRNERWRVAAGLRPAPRAPIRMAKCSPAHCFPCIMIMITRTYTRVRLVRAGAWFFADVSIEDRV